MSTSLALKILLNLMSATELLLAQKKIKNKVASEICICNGIFSIPFYITLFKLLVLTHLQALYSICMHTWFRYRSF